MTSSSPSCRRRRPASCWSSTRKRARLPCPLKRNPTREAQHQKGEVVCVEADAGAGARTSLAVEVDLDREAAAAEASRTEATSEEVN